MLLGSYIFDFIFLKGGHTVTNSHYNNGINQVLSGGAER